MRAVLGTILIATILGGGGVFMWLYYGGFETERGTSIAFIDTYGEYDEIAERVDFLVHLPGTENNTDRAELLTLLDSMLTEVMESERRETLARLAFSNLDVIKKEIDATSASQARLYQSLQNLDNAARVFQSIELRNKADAVVVLARKRAELSSHITSILLEMNEQTYVIITRILEEDGELPAAHINELNIATNEAEERFDDLTELYEELTIKKSELEQTFALFVTTAI